MLVSRRDQISVPVTQWSREAHDVVGMGCFCDTSMLKLHDNFCAATVTCAVYCGRREFNITAWCGTGAKHIVHAKQVPKSVAESLQFFAVVLR